MPFSRHTFESADPLVAIAFCLAYSSSFFSLVAVVIFAVFCAHYLFHFLSLTKSIIEQKCRESVFLNQLRATSNCNRHLSQNKQTNKNTIQNCPNSVGWKLCWAKLAMLRLSGISIQTVSVFAICSSKSSLSPNAAGKPEFVLTMKNFN